MVTIATHDNEAGQEGASRTAMPHRGAFLNLHLTLIRENFFDRRSTAMYGCYSYAYQPPPFVSYVTKLGAEAVAPDDDGLDEGLVYAEVA